MPGWWAVTIDWQAVFLTLRLALLTAMLLLLMGIPVAAWLAFTRWRWKFLVEAVVALPLVLPPTVLGFYVLLALGPNSPVGQAYQGLTGRQLVFNFEALLAGSLLYSLPFAVQPFAAGFAAVDRRIIEAAESLGASRLVTFVWIVLPLSLNGIVTGVVLSFAHTLGEFGVVLMVGGNIPGVTRTVSIDIYDSVQALDYRQAGETALLLLAASFFVLSVVYALNRRAGLRG